MMNFVFNYNLYQRAVNIYYTIFDMYRLIFGLFGISTHACAIAQSLKFEILITT